MRRFPHPVRLSAATDEVAYAVDLKRTTKGHRLLLPALPSGDDEDQRAAEVLQYRIHQLGHDKPGTKIAAQPARALRMPSLRDLSDARLRRFPELGTWLERSERTKLSASAKAPKSR